MKKTLIILASCLMLVGCTKYYKVTEPAGGRTYITTDLKQTKNGAVKFTDAVTKSKLTLQNSEVTKISEKEFKAIKNAK